MTPDSPTTGTVSNYEFSEYSSIGNEVYCNVHFLRGTEKQIEEEACFFLSTRDEVSPDMDISWTFAKQDATPDNRVLETEAGSYWVTARVIHGIEDLHFSNLCL